MRAGGSDLHASRIAFLGVTGTGKSTAALRLGEILGLPVHLVDEEIGWLPCWVFRDKADQVGIADQLTSKNTWILDSVYDSWAKVVLPRAELVIALDYPRRVSLTRLIKRSIQRAACQTRVCNGNTEPWWKLVSTDSILLWHVRTFHDRKARIATLQADPDGPPVLRIMDPQGLENLFTTLQRHERGARTD